MADLDDRLATAAAGDVDVTSSLHELDALDPDDADRAIEVAERIHRGLQSTLADLDSE